MTIPTKLWLAICAIILYSSAIWYHGYHTRGISAELEASQAAAAAATATAKLESEYRQKERQSAERTAKIETDYINEAARDEAEYRAAIERLRTTGAGKHDGLRIKRELTCSGNVLQAITTTSNVKAAPQGGLSQAAGERIIGVGHDADEVAIQLSALQDWVNSECSGKEKAP